MSSPHPPAIPEPDIPHALKHPHRVGREKYSLPNNIENSFASYVIKVVRSAVLTCVTL